MAKYHSGTSRADTLSGGPEADWINGRNGNDTISAFDGNDRMWGGRGNDNLSGGFGNDWLFGGDGKDFLFGEEGNNVLWGGRGDDRLVSSREGLGNDTLIGGGGKDTFIVDLEFGAQGHDMILDFKRGHDRINIESLGEGQPGMLDSFADLDTNHDGRLDRRDDTVTVARGTFTIDFTSFTPNGGTLDLKGIKALYESDFYIT
jgi:Ca2+-binding RTX toxin-like protein